MTREHEHTMAAMLRRLRDICYREYCGLCHQAIATFHLYPFAVAALLLLQECGGPQFSP